MYTSTMQTKLIFHQSFIATGAYSYMLHLCFRRNKSHSNIECSHRSKNSKRQKRINKTTPNMTKRRGKKRAPPPVKRIPSKENRLLLYNFDELNLLLPDSMHSIPFYHFSLVPSIVQWPFIRWMYSIVSVLEHRSNRMVESQNVLIKRIKYSLDSLGHKLITRCSVDSTGRVPNNTVARWREKTQRHRK